MIEIIITGGTPEAAKKFLEENQFPGTVQISLMNDVGILVDEGHLEKAVRWLNRFGWKTEVNYG